MTVNSTTSSLILEKIFTASNQFSEIVYLSGHFWDFHFCGVNIRGTGNIAGCFLWMGDAREGIPDPSVDISEWFSIRTLNSSSEGATPITIPDSVFAVVRCTAFVSPFKIFLRGGTDR